MKRNDTDSNMISKDSSGIQSPKKVLGSHSKTFQWSLSFSLTKKRETKQLKK